MSDIVTRVRELGGLFWRNAKESGEAAAEAIEQRAQIQRLALQVRKLDRERSALIGTIGGKVYSLHGQGKVRNQDVLTDCKRIDDIIVDIAATQREIEKIRAASLEKGIEVPILSDEAPLDDDEGTVSTTPAVVTPAGTFGQQDVPEGKIPKSSIGRVEYDEEGAPLQCDDGPSQHAVPTESCETAQPATPQAPAEVLPGEEEPPTGPSAGI